MIMYSITHYTGELLGCLLAAAPTRGTTKYAQILTPRTRMFAEGPIYFILMEINVVCVCSADGIFYRLSRTNIPLCVRWIYVVILQGIPKIVGSIRGEVLKGLERAMMYFLKIFRCEKNRQSGENIKFFLRFFIVLVF